MTDCLSKKNTKFSHFGGVGTWCDSGGEAVKKYKINLGM